MVRAIGACDVAAGVVAAGAGAAVLAGAGAAEDEDALPALG